MTPDGSKVYFTSAENLTSEAEDTSSQPLHVVRTGRTRRQPLTLISKPDGSAATGTPVCPATTWTTECGAVPFLDASSELADPDSILNAGPAATATPTTSSPPKTATSTSTRPQQLDGSKGILGQQNLYDYRDGEVEYADHASATG